jgi:hypothetical protein
MASAGSVTKRQRGVVSYEVSGETEGVDGKMVRCFRKVEAAAMAKAFALLFDDVKVFKSVRREVDLFTLGAATATTDRVDN